MKKLFVLLVSIMSFSANAEVPAGDTSGKVAAVYIENNLSGHDAFKIYFSSTSSDRWKCIENDGYIKVRSNGIGVSSDSYKMMFSMAMAAQASNKTLTVNSAGSDPCINANNTMIHD